MTGRKIPKHRDDTQPPQDPRVGKLWFDQALGKVRRWDGKEWVNFNSSERKKSLI